MNLQRMRQFWSMYPFDQIQFYRDRAVVPGFDILFEERGEYSVGALLKRLTKEAPTYRNANTVIYELPVRFFQRLYEESGICVFGEDEFYLDGTDMILRENARPKAKAVQRWVYPYKLRGFIVFPDKVQLSLSFTSNLHIL